MTLLCCSVSLVPSSLTRFSGLRLVDYRRVFRKRDAAALSRGPLACLSLTGCEMQPADRQGGGPPVPAIVGGRLQRSRKMLGTLKRVLCSSGRAAGAETSRSPFRSQRAVFIILPHLSNAALTLFGHHSCASTEQKISIPLTLHAGDATAAAKSRPSWHLEAGRGRPWDASRVVRKKDFFFLILSFSFSTLAAAAAERRGPGEPTKRPHPNVRAAQQGASRNRQQ